MNYKTFIAKLKIDDVEFVLSVDTLDPETTIADLFEQLSTYFREKENEIPLLGIERLELRL